MQIHLDKLGLRELNALLAIAQRRHKLMARRRPIAVVRKELIALAVAQGYTIEELIGISPVALADKRPAIRKRAKVAAKFRDPDNKRQTWSGRGRMPRWLADRVRRGHTVADFLIPGLAKPTAKKSSRIGQRSVYRAD